MKRVNIIGYGNAGVTLYNHLVSRVHVAGVFTRRALPDAQVPFVTSLAELSPNVDLNIVCVSDDAIADVVTHLPRTVAVVHTSGSAPLLLLHEFEQHGVLYPLQTLSKKRRIELNKVPFLIEGNSTMFSQKLKTFCLNHLSDVCYEITSDQRAQVHLAAVLANNFSTYLFGTAAEIVKAQQLPENLLDALLEETVSKFIALRYPEAQTGPARRNDSGTIKKHLALLDKSENSEIYQLLSEAIRKKFNA
ncbi:MAG: DUF2520 domain-containing protein [Bacteroidetes bacterium]|nr:DUF2520 domain-containing protein [Bacteroidota bacterium]